MGIYVGVDCGTQSTKVILIDTNKSKILAEASSPHELISDTNGKREQQPQWWISAFIEAFKQAIKQAKIDPQEVLAISVSGQQHGLVVLDKKGLPLYPAKLWCDTETAVQNEQLLQMIGGEEQCLAKLGLVIATGYTASKLLWLKQSYPDIWQQVDKVLLPHDYINYWLTGQAVMEYGDASGTGLLDIYSRCWNKDVIELIDKDGILTNALPTLIKSNTVVGKLKADIAQLLNLNPDVLVASGSGDNMMGAIGTGNTKDGIVTMSLGTSGTLYAYSSTPIKPASKLIANFCSANNGWLPLICTMNVTSTTSLLQKLLKIDLTDFNLAVSSAPIGANGITILPFFNGERVPALPTAKASIYGLDYNNFTVENLCRAMVEGTTLGLRYGLDLFRQKGVNPTQIRLIGGGAKSPIWRQIVADMMNCEVICLAYSEAAALGAAIQAALVHICSYSTKDEQQLLNELTDQFVILEQSTLTTPNIQNVQQYEKVYTKYCAILTKNYLED